MLASARQIVFARQQWSRNISGLWAAVCIAGALFLVLGCLAWPAAIYGSPCANRGISLASLVDSAVIATADVISPTVESAGEATVPASDAITLTMWTTEAFSPLQSDAGSQILRQQVARFSADFPQVTVDFVLKKPYGEGGISNFLQTTGAVVPQGLPDLAIVDVEEVPQLAALGLVHPLEGLVSPDLLGSQFPFAQKACTVGGQLMCMQFEADLTHLVYDMGSVPVPPLSWAEVLSGTARYAFPAGGAGSEGDERVNDGFWLQYLSAGGASPDNQAPLSEATIAEVLEFYRDGVDRGVIPETVLDYRAEADAWTAYLSGQAAMANATSLRYLNSRDKLNNSGFAQVPTRDGKPFSVSRGWAIAIVAADKARQETSARFLEWLLRPENNGPWTKATHRLPTLRRSLDTWDKSDSYTSFISGLLDVAEPYPSAGLTARAEIPLQRGIREVVLGSTSPDQAAAGVVSALEQ